MPGGKSVFHEDWLKIEKYKDWLLSVADSRYKARCSLCNRTFDISNMGESAVKYHMKGKKHQNLVKNNSKMKLKFFYNEDHPESSSSGNQTSTSNFCRGDDISKTLLDQSVNMNNLCAKAEILWALKVLQSHYSYKSCENIAYIFKTMFSDSEIAKHFTCGEKKTAYLSVFGIAPYFSSLLTERVNSESSYVLLFDESMNEVNQSKQLDCHVRFWNHNKITTRYYSSDFLGHATSELLFEKISEKCLKLGVKNLLQLSMDGPNVNLKVLEMMMKDMVQEHSMCLLNAGTCGLHIMHNAYEGGCSAAFPEVERAASASYKLFKDSPARREDFASLKPDIKFPLKFCKHRWLENESVFDRLLEILPDIKSYIKKVEEKKFSNPNNKSFETIKEMSKDALFSAKCNFVLSVINDIEPFLKLYQTDKPMLPFLNSDLYNLLKDLLHRFLKEDKLPKSSFKLISLNVDDKELYKDARKINIGFVAKKLLNNFKDKQKFSSEKKIMEFYLNCRQFFIKLTKKLIEKCPLNFSLVRNISCLDPRTLTVGKEANLKKLQNILLYLTDAGRVKEADCDSILKEYNIFISDFSCMDNATKFKNCCSDSFDPVIDRLDVFYYEFLSNNSKYTNLWKVLQILLLLSHGQATVERGFSVNKNLLVENLGKETIVAKRIIDDYIRFIGGLENLIISKELMISASGARQKYVAYLEEQKKCKQHKVQSVKRKLLIENIDNLKRKKRCLESDIAELNRTSDEYSENAEKKSDLALVAKSNALRRHAKNKVVELGKCEEDLEQMYIELKSV